MRPIINSLLDPVVNFGKVTVSIGYDSIATEVILITGDGAKLPNPVPDGSFNLVWFNNSTYSDPSDDPYVEIVRCIARIGNTLTLMRGQEGTATSDKNISGKIYKMLLSPTKKTIDDIQTESQSKVDAHSALSTGVHGMGIDTIDGVGARNIAISSHSSTTSSVHNFDSSGNAPAQTHGISRHTGNIGTEASITFTTTGGHAHTGLDSTKVDHTDLTSKGSNTHDQIDTALTASAGHIAAPAPHSGHETPSGAQSKVDTHSALDTGVHGVGASTVESVSGSASKVSTHSSATLSVHGFDSSGNAPAQIHGSSKHTGTIGDHTTNLSNVGSNTHAQIDTAITASNGHIAANGTSVHGLGTISTQNANSVSISGGSVTGITDLAVADGGTGRGSAVAYAPICGGITDTSTQQSVASVGTAGQVLTSNGASALPTFQAVSATGNAATVTIANEATDTTCFPLFTTDATGNLGPKTVSSLTFNSNTGNLGATTLTATTLVGRLNAREETITSSSTPTPNIANGDIYTVTALAANATFGIPTGTPLQGQKLTIRIKDNGSARTLAWNSIYRAGTDVVLPTVTVISKTMYVGFIYNYTDTKWDLVALINNI